ncbi:ras guanine nucleotide exchange factor F isoform X2 [Betta splendens]|nr:ras guanine nucleotide exchange factor F isoform X2 [Betta splendens]
MTGPSYSMGQSGNSLWTQLFPSSPSPCDRYKHASCSYDGNVYILGGRDNSCLRDFWRYNIVCNEWTELSCTSEAAPEELEEHSMVAHEGILYVFGGMLDSAYTKCKCALWVFDIDKQKWVQSQEKPSIRQAQMPTNRKGHSAVVMGSAMLVYGGYVDIKGSSPDFWSLNFDTMAWSQLSESQNSSGPGPRHNHSAVVYDNCMYLFGGLRGLRELRDFWRWNSSSHMWTSLRTKSGPSKLIGHSAATYKDCMLVFGGGEIQNTPTNSLWRYSFTSHTWWQVAVHPGCNAPSKIHHSCTGLGSSYEANTIVPSVGSRLNDKHRPFKNRCFPASLTSLESEGAIEMETFRLDKCYAGDSFSRCSELESSNQDLTGNKDPEKTGNCLTFEKANRTLWSYKKDDLLQGEDEDIVKHLPDLLLVIGGRPLTCHSPISIWHMTLTAS